MDFIKFLGTAGARFVTIKQLRSSAGIWLKFKNTNIIIDPGPGSIVRVNSAKPKLDPFCLDAIILTHKHLDHVGDVNVMVEAMTQGGFKKRGVVFAPSDALGQDGVVYSYIEAMPEKFITLRKGEYNVGDVRFKAPIANKHTVKTYGLKFYLGKEVISYISDTRYFDGLVPAYKDSTILILNVVFHERRDQYDHLCLEDAIKLIKKIKPKKTILTHFGMTMLKNKPRLIEQRLKADLGVDIKCAYDGMTIELLG
jgi:ribonuclease BN (tRNA processing enzyme)